MRHTTQTGFFAGVFVIGIREKIGVYKPEMADLIGGLDTFSYPGIDALYVPETERMVDDARELLLASLR